MVVHWGRLEHILEMEIRQLGNPSGMHSKEPKKVHIKLDCDICGKPFKPANRGSLTGWIFGEDSFANLKDTGKYCNCQDNDASKPFSAPKSSHVETSDLLDVAQKEQAGTTKALADDLNIGRKIADRYELLMVIGEGGMSTVYKANDGVLAKILALKMLRREFADNETSIKRFEQEANAVRSLTHPHLATVYDYGRTEDGSPYLVMDYIEGDSLAEAIQKDVFFDIPRALAICLQVCTAVSYAHKHGVIHRDLKPSNIILTYAGGDHDFVKLIDFGIAKLQAEGGLMAMQKVTQTGEIFGSPLYMSPEQCMGYPLDFRSDIYSLGCVMYELITGKPPLIGENPVQTIFKHLNEKPAPLSSSFKALEIPRGFESLIMKTLEKKPEDRYQSVDELREDLKLVWLGKDPGKAAVKAVAGVPFWKSRNTVLYVILAAALTYGTVASALLWQSNHSPRPPNLSTSEPKQTPELSLANQPDILALAPNLVVEDHEKFRSSMPAKLAWKLEKPEFKDLEFDLRFYNDLPPGPVVFLRLYEGEIGSSHFYIGFQTNLHDPNKPISPGRGMIFSRWKTANLADARVAPLGWTEVDPKTPFVGLRHLYPWTNHRYRVRLSGVDPDETGIWYQLSIEDLDTGKAEIMGALKFPKEQGQYPLIKDRGWSMIQILRGVKYEKDIPHWHFAFNHIYLDKNYYGNPKVQVDYGQPDAADVYVQNEGSSNSAIHVLMHPDTKNQHSP